MATSKLDPEAGKNWLSIIKAEAKSEGFVNPSKDMSKGITLDGRSGNSLAKEYDFFEGWYIRAKVKASEYYIISRSTGNQSIEYCTYKFYSTLEEVYEARVKTISREYSRRENELRASRL